MSNNFLFTQLLFMERAPGLNLNRLNEQDGLTMAGGFKNDNQG